MIRGKSNKLIIKRDTVAEALTEFFNKRTAVGINVDVTCVWQTGGTDDEFHMWVNERKEKAKRK